MDWIKWRLPPRPRLPFIMQLFFPGGGKHGRLCPTRQPRSAPRVVTGARKCLAALRELKRHLLYTHFFSGPPPCHCSLFRRLELVLATLPLKLFSWRLLWSKTSNSCLFPPRWLRESGAGGMCILVSSERREASSSSSPPRRLPRSHGAEGPRRCRLHKHTDVGQLANECALMTIRGGRSLHPGGSGGGACYCSGMG